MPTAQLSIDVDVTPERFLSVLRDYERYPEFQPDVKSVRVMSRGEGVVHVGFAIDAKLALIEYTLEHRDEGPTRIAWRLVEGQLVRHNSGAWELAPLPGDRTRATYRIDIAFAGPTPPGLERALEEKGLPRMLANFKARAEKLFAAAREGG
jgi:coenzyme Q-binding protein COQ10